MYAGELFVASFALSVFISYITIAYSGLWVGFGKWSFCNGYLDMVDDVMSKCFFMPQINAMQRYLYIDISLIVEKVSYQYLEHIGIC